MNELSQIQDVSRTIEEVDMIDDLNGLETASKRQRVSANPAIQSSFD